MTHPDILRIERTGYPYPKEGMRYCVECEDEATTNHFGDWYCSECLPVVCVMCNFEAPTFDARHGICSECLYDKASDEATAFAYAKQSTNAAESISDFLTTIILSEGDPDYDYLDIEEQYDIHKRHEFFTKEMQAIIRIRLDGGELQEVNYYQVRWPAIEKGIGKAMECYCMDDKDMFAEWISTQKAL